MKLWPLLLVLAVVVSSEDEKPIREPCIGGLRFDAACKKLSTVDPEVTTAFFQAFAQSRYGGVWATSIAEVEERVLEGIWTACPSCRGIVPDTVSGGAGTTPLSWRAFIDQVAPLFKPE